jgi:hypothetical protein
MKSIQTNTGKHKKKRKESCAETAVGFIINLTTGIYSLFRNLAHDNILTLTSSFATKMNNKASPLQLRRTLEICWFSARGHFILTADIHSICQ